MAASKSYCGLACRQARPEVKLDVGRGGGEGGGAAEMSSRGLKVGLIEESRW